MEMLYASKIVMEAINPKTGNPRTFADAVVNDYDLPELVPVEYGGTDEG